MTKATLGGLVSVLALVTLVLGPDRALADSRQHFKGPSQRQNRLHSVPPQRFSPRRFDHRHHGAQRHFGRSVPYGIVGSPAIIYSPPVYSTPVYVPAPAYYPPPPPPVYAPPVSAAPPPTETVIEHPTGRYELRGDGITTPYRWVWVPNPPSEPPADAVPEVTPKAAPAPAEPAKRTELYRWTDDTGVVHWTDRWDKVPEAYRKKVTKLQS